MIVRIHWTPSTYNKIFQPNLVYMIEIVCKKNKQTTNKIQIIRESCYCYGYYSKKKSRLYF